MKWMAWMLPLALVLTAGCASKTPADGPATGSQQPLPQTAPATPVGSKPPAAGTGLTGGQSALTVPSAKPGDSFMPMDLAVSEEGRTFLLWTIGGAEGGSLTAWGTGDTEAVTFSNVAVSQGAFANDGFSYVKLTPDSKPQIHFYTWGDKKDHLVVDSSTLKGYPRGLHHDTKLGLIFADDEGLKAVAAGQAPRKLQSPGFPSTLHGNPYEPHSDRYVTVIDGKLVLASLSKPDTVPLADVGSMRLTGVAWGQDPARVAVEFADPTQRKNVVQVYDVSPGSQPKQVFGGEGAGPAILHGALYYRYNDGVFERPLGTSNGQQVAQLQSGILVSDPVTKRLYFIDPGNQTGKLPFMEAK